ncbi:hypothetical protein SAMN04488550_0181 [Gordonia malaquae]|uniref:Uncharacterized protein n=1 Tax=Gordonia malaquae NBRC 108250 TaxID=1223542 RepID=M3UNA2_GORML|nr:hypothetical protein [Gordonia malaquae]GAC81565.1 hypothetical protein GM1_038_00180 [Gordonia malaquae NBRC 108250]SEB50178.1 hypothetical protein SAMN04488550_0181 [Gordonia malaquae]
MEHNGAVRRPLDVPDSEPTDSPTFTAAVDATIADLRSLREEEMPVPDDVQARIRETIASLTHR